MIISVIMAVYNEPEAWLRQSIESILQQTYKDFEFIILLDNPNNVELESLINSYAKKDERICFLRNEINIGLSLSLAKGIKLAKGTYIARMDADDISGRDRLEKQLSHLEMYQLDIVGSNIQYIDENGNAIRESRKVMNNKFIGWVLFTGSNALTHPTFFGKAEVFRRIGYRRIPLVEDKDFIHRAVIAGYRLGNIENILLEYRVRSNSLSQSNLSRQMRNGRVLSKHFRRNRMYQIEYPDFSSFDFESLDKQSEVQLARYSLAMQKLLLGYQEIKKRRMIGFYYCFQAILISPLVLIKPWKRLCHNLLYVFERNFTTSFNK